MLARRHPLLLRSTVAVIAAALAVGCDKNAEVPLAPAVLASAVVAPPPPAGPKVLRLVVDPTSKTTIDMPAPKEHIKADTTAAAGELTIDPSDLRKTRGLVKIDLTSLKTHTFDDDKKNAAQTEHAQNWFEAGELVTPEVKETNRWAIFTIQAVDGLTETDLSKVPAAAAGAGDVKSIAATVKGDFVLHGRQVHKDVPVEVTFRYPSGQAATAVPTRVEVHTKTPLHVVLAEHDVKPRDNLGKLAQASFSILGTKVAETADLTLDLAATVASAPPAADPAPAPTPSASH
jgi:hypothetical protein